MIDLPLQLDPSSVWLQDDLTNKAFVPDAHNCFDLRNERFSAATTLNVHGSAADVGSSSGSLSLSSTPSSSRGVSFR